MNFIKFFSLQNRSAEVGSILADLESESTERVEEVYYDEIRGYFEMVILLRTTS